MRAAEDQAAIYAVAPTYQPGTDCPVPAKVHYTREEAYQSLQWEIHRMKQQIRAYKEERKLELSKKQAASATGRAQPGDQHGLVSAHADVRRLDGSTSAERNGSSYSLRAARLRRLVTQSWVSASRAVQLA